MMAGKSLSPPGTTLLGARAHAAGIIGGMVRPRAAIASQPCPGDAVIKVSVMYPNQPGARFDHGYYRDIHMPLAKSLLGDACLYYTIDKGLAGGAPGAPPAYIAMCHFFCASVASFQAAFGPHAQEILADIPNYTDLQPVMQLSEVVVEHS
jgi:uncharacterized protein (TIGR02118 family)